jgi:hypothetical protein
MAKIRQLEQKVTNEIAPSDFGLRIAKSPSLSMTQLRVAGSGTGACSTS